MKYRSESLKVLERNVTIEHTNLYENLRGRFSRSCPLEDTEVHGMSMVTPGVDSGT